MASGLMHSIRQPPRQSYLSLPLHTVFPTRLPIPCYEDNGILQNINNIKAVFSSVIPVVYLRTK